MPFPQSTAGSNTGTWTKWVSLFLMLFGLGHLLYESYHSSLSTLHNFALNWQTTLNECRAVGKDTAIDLARLDHILRALQLEQEAIELSMQLLNASTNDIQTQYRRVEETCEANGLRIDNVWEALAPPNANGTYFPSSSETCQLAEDVDRRLGEVYQRLGSPPAPGRQLGEDAGRDGARREGVAAR
ncbi:hypothetical protein BU26DRAFT_514506 [Trematosphaeria pertusa]|uniref:Uncharacterized protein n=1 Tax=Trematosphaeria pertusa TaxID=390896 RepID=A0A6A6IW80_9PLEO|nr:uncharacterized protein BU26DRAFT_514506 [Trematosphaeria pertusa]KAF2254626.1 hypothetical protein BU26DRAFT_514506 [Trematosphaeria pertusa]